MQPGNCQESGSSPVVYYSEDVIFLDSTYFMKIDGINSAAVNEA